MENINPQQTFLKQLRVFYGAETHLSETLIKMIGVAGTRELRDVLDNHLRITHNQISILEKVFKNLQETPGGPPNAVVTVMLQEEGIFGDSSSGNFYDDTDIIIAARKIHHYEMTGFGNLVNLSGKLEDKTVESLLTNSNWQEPLPRAQQE